MRIRVELLTDENEQLLDEYLRRDVVTSALVLEDLHDPEKRKFSKFHLALRDGEPDGYLLVYHHPDWPFSFVWLRGSAEAAERLIELLRVDRAWLHSDPELSELIKQRLPVEFEAEAEVMILERGCESLSVRHPVKQLDRSDAEAILELSREVPELPPFQSLGHVERMLKAPHACAFGIFIDRKLASLACGRRKPASGLGEIGPVLTSPTYRGRGFAATAVSAVVRYLFEEIDVDKIYLHVLSHNTPAKRMYQKVGFRTYRRLRYFDLRTGSELFRIWGRRVR